MSSTRIFTDVEMKALRLLKKRHRPVAVEMALGMGDGSATKLRKRAAAIGWVFPKIPRTSAPLTVREYVAACRSACVVPRPQAVAQLTAPAADVPWPHLVDYPLPAAPRSKAAGEQAARIGRAVQHMRYVPASAAGGGRLHFGRECAEHLAMLIAYAPGKAYRDDPVAARPEPRVQFSPPAATSYGGSPFAQVLEVA